MWYGRYCFFNFSLLSYEQARNRQTALLVLDVTAVSTLAGSYVATKARGRREMAELAAIPPPPAVNVRNTLTSYQHTLSFQSPWRPWAQWRTLHTISLKTLAARLVKCLVTTENGRSFFSGCQSQSNVLMRPRSTSHLLGTTIRTSSYSTFAFNFFLCFQPLSGVYKIK